MVVFHGWNRSAELVLEAWHKLAPRFSRCAALRAGHSFGGVITSLMLAQEPQQFRRAMLLDPVLFTPIMIGGWRFRMWWAFTSATPWPRLRAQPAPALGQLVEAYASLGRRGMFKGWKPEALQAYA